MTDSDAPDLNCSTLVASHVARPGLIRFGLLRFPVPPHLNHFQGRQGRGGHPTSRQRPGASPNESSRALGPGHIFAPGPSFHMQLNTHPEIADKRERSLQIAHELVDKVKVRESGANRGFWVEKFLSAAGLGPGYAWCAAFVNFCLRTAGVDKKSLPKRPASVLGWVEWADQNDRLTYSPDRGDLFWWLDGDHGHIGFYIRGEEDMETLEGNTNLQGSREGDGAYRKLRALSLVRRHRRSGFISLKGL